MKPAHTLLVVGGGLAGAQAADAARSSGYDGRILIVGNETQPPYERPPLSKSVLRGEAEPTSLRVHDSAFYAERGIEVVTGETVTSFDVDAHQARLAGGETIGFEAVVLATGAEPRRLDLPGATLSGVHYLRTIEDAALLATAIRAARRVAVIGAGWIGSEVAASARQMGVEVVLIEPAPVPLHRIFGTEIGGMFRQLHADHGVALRHGVGVVELQGDDTVEKIVLTDGRVELADVVVVGIGAVPRLELAQAAGLRINAGVVVDEYLRASAPGVYAAGDIAEAWHPRYHRHIRVEHWANALNQGAAAGVNAAGHSEPYTRLPYFYSVQYDLGLEYVGYAEPDDQLVIRGDVPSREFIAFYHRDGTVTAAMAVNVWDVIDDLKSIVSSTRPADVLRLADPNVPLGEIAAPA